MAGKKKVGMTAEHKARVHHPIDVAIHRLSSGSGSVVDFHNVLYRAMVGRMMAEKFLIAEDQEYFARVEKIALLIKERNETQLTDPRVNLWKFTALETEELLEMHRLVIEMHDEIHHKHFKSTYLAVNNIVIQMLRDFEKKFPPKKKTSQMKVVRETATA